MHQLKRETADETLKKLASFDWSKKTAVTLVICESESTHQSVPNKDKVTKACQFTNYNQDISIDNRRQFENLQLGTQVNKANHETGMITPPTQKNEDHGEKLNFISQNLILIAYKNDFISNQEYITFKNNVFTLLQDRVSKIIVPRHNDPDFVSSFIHQTIEIGISHFKYYASYLRLETIFWELVNFSKHKRSDDLSNLDKLKNITVSKYFCEPIVCSISNKRTSNNVKIKCRSEQEKKSGKANENKVSPLYYTQSTANSRSSYAEQAAKSQVPYPRGMNEVTMSPISLDGDNDSRQLEERDVPELNPSISFVTSLNPERTTVADGHCRVCHAVTNRICIGCSKLLLITYYCSQTCQEREWSSHMYHCWKPA